jgi:sortase A
MTDRRTVDDLSIEEIEQILVMKRRDLRCERLRRLARAGRVVDDPPPPKCEAASVIRETTVTEGPAKSASRFWSFEYETAQDVNNVRERSPGKDRAARRPSAWRDRVLLGLEVVALIGLVAIAVGSFTNLKALNEEVAQAREVQPTPTATPMIQALVLPGGSAPPAVTDDVPEAYRNLVRPMPSMQVPTPSPQQPTRIVIPSIGVDSAVVRGDSWEDLKKGAGHHIGSVNPGERGNMIISAHNDVFGEVFRRLEDVELEDGVTVYTGSQTYEYKIKAKRVVEPSDVSVMGPASRPVLTLITCYPYLVDTHRLIVIAELQR